MKKLIHATLGVFMIVGAGHTTRTPIEFKLELGAPIKNANLSGQCPRYKISNKPALMPRFKCRFS